MGMVEKEKLKWSRRKGQVPKAKVKIKKVKESQCMGFLRILDGSFISTDLY
jgi:hypothetical protein